MTLTFDRLTSIPHAITDSRTPADYHETVFFALRTPAGDGHRYIAEMYEKGIRSFVVAEDAHIPSMPDADIYVSDDTRRTLLEAATVRRQRLRCPVVAITGSRGKTIVKEQINALLAPHIKVTRSPRSWNSSIGVPLSMWNLDTDADVAILEAGISHHGEMAPLAAAIAPEIGVFTSLTDEHSDGFESDEAKCIEKISLFASCHTIIYNCDNQVVDKIIRRTYGDRKLIPVKGSNIDLSIAVARLLYPGIDQSTLSLRQLSARIDIAPTPQGASVAFDSYATDNDGVAAALDYLRRRQAPGHDIVAILGAPIDSRILTHARVRRVISIGWGSGPDSYPDVDSFASTLTSSDFIDDTIYINGPDKKSFSALRDQLCSLRHITRLGVNLEALTSNFKYYRSLLPDSTGTIAMIKADAYGCGAVEVARTLQAAGADAFAVAVVDEGISLRQAMITRPIIVLDPWCTNPRAIVSSGLEPTLISADPDIARALNDCVPDGQTLFIHVKLDTGMHRLGLEPADLEAFSNMIARYPRLRVRSMFSHLSTADCIDQDEYTHSQLKLFDDMTERLSRLLGYKPARHILNTPGTRRLHESQYTYDFVRLGIGLYGIDTLEATRWRSPLQVVASLTTTVIAITRYPAGATIGYGRRGVLDRPSLIATLPIGYADGLNRRLSCGAASFIIDGVACPTVGNICMDLCMIDVTDCPSAHVGSSVEIFGPTAPIQKLADTLGTIPYEVLTWVSPRVKRVYHSSN